MDNSANLTIAQPNKSRRKFIKELAVGLGYVAVGSFTLSSVTSCTGAVNPTSSNPNATIAIDITRPENKALAAVGGTIAIKGNELDSSGMLIERTGDNTVAAFSRTCTHRGCTLPNFSNGISSCPCHGSQFNTSGKVVKGPASRPLKRYNASITGNIITITA